MKILYVASEAMPFASSGGLGDVIGSLPAEVKKQLGDSADVRVVIPMYPCVRERFGPELFFEKKYIFLSAWTRQ